MTDAFYTMVEEFSRYLPTVFAAVLILVLGVVLAKLLKAIIHRMVTSLQRSPLLTNTPLEMVMGESESVKRVAEMVSGVAYWILICFVLQQVFTALGLPGVAALFEQIVNYVPRVFKALLVLVIALGLGGLVESFVKQMIRSWDVDVARMSGVVSGYVVMIVGVLAAVSELGIARDFIMVLFVGLVAALSLGVGLALGLGGQDAVRRAMAKLEENLETRSSTQEMPTEADSSKPRRRAAR